MAIEIEPTGSKDTGVCACCGHNSRSVWGLAHAADRTLGAYFVHWTPGHIADQGANIDMIVGDWGDGTVAEQRRAIGLAYRLTDTGPSLMVIDVERRAVSRSPLVGRALRRDEVIGTQLAQDVFEIADAVLGQDERLAELLGQWRIQS